jgi:hypothetical protein
MIQDVLIFTPVLRLEPETIKAITALEWEGAKSLLLQCDNPHPDQRDKLKRRVMNHLHQYQRGREVFLDGRYDALMIVESDIIPPKDALIKLAKMDADLAYGVYRFRLSNVVNIFEMYPGKPRNVGESLSIRPGRLAAAVKAGITKCSGAGFGCILIKRQVLEQIEFRVEWPKNGGHCDSPFVRDAMRRGFDQRADMSVICGHKDEHGQILWPELPEVIHG